MNKILLLFCASFIAQIGYGQYTGILHPAISKLVIESTYIVTDFAYDIVDNSKIHLTWNVSNINGVDFFSVERSANGKEFEMIEVFKLLSDNKFELTDESPLSGRSFYRISTSVKGKPVYSKTLTVYVGGGVPFKFYPNPVDNVLIIRSDIPLDVQIADASGNIRITQPKIQSLQTINVSSLEKGIYIIRFTNRLSNKVIIEKLFKN